MPSFCLLLFLSLLLTSSSSLQPLLPYPVQLRSSIVQCGCNNSALSVLTPSGGSPNTTQIVLTGFFSFDSATDSECSGTTTTGHLLPAALVALDEINSSPDILPDYHLTLDPRDSRGCDVLHATTEFIDSIAGRIRDNDSPDSFNLGVLGPGCEAATEAVAGVIDRSLRLPVVSYGLDHLRTTLRGSDKQISTLFYVSRSILVTMQSAISLLRHLNWTERVAFVSEDSSDFFLSTIENVVRSDVDDDTVLSGNGNANESIPLSVFVKLPTESRDSTLMIQTFFEDIRENGTRVIVALVSQRIAAQLICMGQKETIPGDGFLYVFVGTYSENWWQTEVNYCTLTAEAVQSVIIVSGSIINPDSNAILASGNTIHDFKVEFLHRRSMWCDSSAYKSDIVDPLAGLVYDAVWATALALNQSTDFIDDAVERGVQYDQTALQAVIGALKSVNFSGITGTVQFGEDRIGAESVQQIQGGGLVVVGMLAEGEFSPFVDFQWNGSDATPDDTVREDAEGVQTYLLILGLLFTVAGVVFAVVTWVFNCYYSKHRILRASSQKLNYVIIIGVIFGYMTVLLLTILESPLGGLMSDELFKALCLIRIWMLSLAFTFTYGTLLARAWRIYRVFTNPWKASRPYKDYHLMLMVLGLAAIDCAILITWTIIDPYRRFPVETEIDYDSFSRCVFSSCSSTNVTIWLPVLSIFKVGVIILGLGIIILVRREVVARKIFDDTKSLALALYITAIAFLIGVPLTILFLLANSVVFSYVASSVWVNISSSGTLVCVFMPKVYHIMVKKESGRKYRAAGRLYYGKGFVTQQSIDCALDESQTGTDL